jgi:hypothetical protein
MSCLRKTRTLIGLPGVHASVGRTLGSMLLCNHLLTALGRVALGRVALGQVQKRCMQVHAQAINLRRTA